MAWVRSAYAGELAVLSTWLCALIPWSVSFGSENGVSLAVVRFQYFLLQFVSGLDVPDVFLPVWEAPAFAASATVTDAYYAWAAGAAVLAVALVVSVLYYAREDRLEAGPVDPVRLLGGLLLTVGIVESGATALLWDGYAVATVPVGVLFCLVLGGVLLRVERA